MGKAREAVGPLRELPLSDCWYTNISGKICLTRVLTSLPGTGGQLSLNGQLCLVVLGAKNLPVRSDGTLNSFVKG